jgi:hypothetical protein
MAILAAGMVCPPSALAQVGYSPATPTLSPWMGLWERNKGPLDPYHNNVQPQLQLQNILRQQDTSLEGQETTVRMLGQQVGRIENGETSQGETPPPSVGSVFMNGTHFYPNLRTNMNMNPRATTWQRSQPGGATARMR